MSETELVDGIADVIQRVYGDPTQTVLDRRAAAEIWAYLESRGVMPLQMVAAIIQAAGGEVAIPDNVLVDPPTELVSFRDEMNDTLILKARYRAANSPSFQLPGVGS